MLNRPRTLSAPNPAAPRVVSALAEDPLSPSFPHPPPSTPLPSLTTELHFTETDRKYPSVSMREEGQGRDARGTNCKGFFLFLPRRPPLSSSLPILFFPTDFPQFSARPESTFYCTELFFSNNILRISSLDEPNLLVPRRNLCRRVRTQGN